MPYMPSVRFSDSKRTNSTSSNGTVFDVGWKICGLMLSFGMPIGCQHLCGFRTRTPTSKKKRTKTRKLAVKPQSTGEREAKSRVIEKKPPKAAINLGTDVDAPWGEKIETSRKDNHQIA